MNVYQLIYTKFEAWEHSPARKSGFHTAYYSKDLLTPEKILELEKWMVFPTKRAWKDKDVVFFTEIEGRPYLVVLHSHYLDEARDHTGRMGIYLCQGLLFPPESWQPMKDPLVLLDLVKEKGLIFEDREAVLESVLSNQETGDLKPLFIPDEEIVDPTTALPEFTEFEYGIIILILKCLSNEFKQSLFMQGSPVLVHSIYRKIFTFLPIGYKIKMGWDPDFRREVFLPFPARLIGVGRWLPKADRIIILDLSKEDIFQTLSIAEANSTFIRWINKARLDIHSSKQIELGYQLSLIMDEDQTFEFQDYSEVMKGFVAANNNQISRLFIKKAQEKFALDSGSSDHLSQYFNSSEKLQLIIDHLPSKEFYDPLEKLIFEKKKNITLPPDLISQAGPKLNLLSKIQQGERLNIEDLEILEPDDIQSFIHYLLVCVGLDQNWILKFLESYPAPLEAFLIQGNFKISQLTELIAWSKRIEPPQGNYPYIKAYLFPRLGLDESVLQDKKAMAKVVECLNDQHQFQLEDMENIGLEDKNQFQPQSHETRGPEKSGLRKFLGF